MTITITANSLDEIREMLFPQEAPVPVPGSAPGTTPNVDPAPVAAAPAPEPTPAPAPTVDEQQVRAALHDVRKEKDIDAVKAILAKFGVSRVPDLKPEQYFDVIEEATKCLTK